MRWAALLPVPLDSASPIEPAALGVWMLQFTPRVTLQEQAVLAEMEASARLFGGAEQLCQLVEQGGEKLGARVAWCSTGLGALALVRTGQRDGLSKPLTKVLDALPLESIASAAKHQATLARVGCRTLADVRRLPRGGLGRRFDKELLAAMDQAYGLRPEAYEWLTLPETFTARLELMSRVDTAPALLFGARRLLLQMSGWLAARHLGATAFTLAWNHDDMRARDAGIGGELTVRTGAPTQNVDHLARLLSEHLAKTTLLAPAGDIALHATEVHPIVEESRSLIPDTRRHGITVDLALERIQARLGAGSVLMPMEKPDHRLEWTQNWADLAKTKFETVRHELPLPTWVLPEPLLLTIRENRPYYQGPLQLLLGPDRVEGGWWHRVGEGEAEHTATVQRDYWLAMSPTAGVLWVFQARLAGEKTAWYLHGHYG